MLSFDFNITQRGSNGYDDTIIDKAKQISKIKIHICTTHRDFIFILPCQLSI